MKINYVLDDKNIIKSYQTIPFDNKLPTLEIADLSLIVLGKSKVISGVLINDSKNESMIQQYPRNYKQLVNVLIRNKYSLEDEIAIIRQKDQKLDEYNQYYAFIEQCKINAKKIINQQQGEKQ